MPTVQRTDRDGMAVASRRRRDAVNAASGGPAFGNLLSRTFGPSTATGCVLTMNATERMSVCVPTLETGS
jgi:hypothetical protein